MSWLPTTAASALRRQEREGATRASLRARTESIRAAMLASLDGVPRPVAEAVARRAFFATDAERLWYLRPELMSVLASTHGEAMARRKLGEISVLFHEVLPPGLAQFSSPMK